MKAQYALGPAIRCTTCGRDPQLMNNDVSECSHVDCPHRRKAWSDRPSQGELFKGPWPKNTDRDPEPLDVAISKQEEGTT